MYQYCKKKILLLEDDVIMSKFLLNLLEQIDFLEIYPVKTVEEAFELIKRNSFTLAIIDVNLSKGQKGYELGNYLNKNLLFPFIYISSDVDLRNLDYIKSSKPDAFLIKPFRGFDFILTITVLLNKYSCFENLNEFKNYDLPFQVVKCIEYIEKNIYNKIEVKDLAGLVKCSEAHIFRIFKESLNITPHNFIKNVKMNKGKELIEKTDLDISSISFELQYISRANFTKNFKQFYGLTPSEYREIYKRKQNI
jgi:AraC-like DNA-binding protein/CheY-like chemotaxis protein